MHAPSFVQSWIVRSAARRQLSSVRPRIVSCMVPPTDTTPAKRPHAGMLPDEQKMPGDVKTIATHNGTFHCDEALAIHMLRSGVTEYANARIVRTRDQALLDSADCVVDVGATYDPARSRFDHHQRGFSEVFSPLHKTKLSSAGLIYKHFGKQIISSRAPALSPDEVDRVYGKLYTSLIESIDGIDNGVEQYDTDKPANYLNSTHLSSRVSRLNPRWNDTTPDPDGAFEKAVRMVGEEFHDHLDDLTLSWLPARKIVVEAIESRFSVHKSGRIVLLKDFVPWKSHIFDIELDLKIDETENVLYVLYPDQGSKWRVQAVPTAPNSFESRLPLAEPWRGVRGDELSALCGVPGCIFVHASGFIGGNETQDGAHAMAVKTMAMAVS